MPPNARFLVGMAVGYFVVPKLVILFWGVVGNRS